ncbi:MAG TPA: signal peptidase I [Verrucomicrobiae bacterium]|jgi:signal peptidase I
MIRWLFSKTIREAVAMRKHVQRLLNAQRDILSPQAIAAIQLKINELNTAIAEKANAGKIRIKTEELQFAAEKWLKPYPNAVWRENVEVLLVALAVAMAIRTFFIQPFKIPTGSMQPTLYGVTSEPDFSAITIEAENAEAYGRLDDTLKAKLQAAAQAQLKLQNSIIIPTGLERIKEWFEGYSYVHVVAQNDGELQAVNPPFKILIFNIKQTLVIGGVAHTIWFPPDYGEAALQYRAGLSRGHFYHKGDDVVKMRSHAGDHLFVDRFTYNFRKPERGEIIVFATQGIDSLPQSEQGTFYIKRLVGLGGETLSIKQDGEVQNVPRMGTVPIGHLVVNGEPLSASTPHFENLYAFANTHEGQAAAYQDNQYYEHGMLEGLAPGNSFQVESNHYFVMGDNTMNSSDSRYWGDFSSDHVIGKSFFVYWPITQRFGLDNH